MRNKLLITNRPLKGENDGPEIILDLLFQESDIDSFDFCYDYKIISSVSDISPKLKIPFLHIHKELFFLFKNYKKLKAYEKIVIFSYYSCPIIFFLIKIMRLDSPRIIVIGYDSYYRENLLKMKKQKKIFSKFYFYLKSILLRFVEYLASLISEKIYLVSEGCINFSRAKINQNGQYQRFPIIPKINKSLFKESKKYNYKDILIIGPFTTEIDMIDLKKNLMIISSLKHIENIHFFGKNSTQAKNNSKYPGKVYEYLDDFDSFFSTNSDIIVYNRINTPGIQTKLQKIVMYNNLVFCHSGIDVGDDLKPYCYDITELTHLKKNHRQVNLVDIINASDNTLNVLKPIAKDF